MSPARSLLAAAVLCASALTLSMPAIVAAQGPGRADESVIPQVEDEVQLARVVVDGEPLFSVVGTESYPAEERARLIAGRIRTAAGDRAVDPGALRVEDSPSYTSVFAGKVRLLVVTDKDAEAFGVARPLAAKEVAVRIGAAIAAFRRDRQPDMLMLNGARSVVWALVLAAVIAGAWRLLARLRGWIESRLGRRLEDVEARSFRLLRAGHVWMVVSALLKTAGIAAAAVAVFVFLQITLGEFPWTRGFSRSLVLLVLDPVRTLADGFVNSLPGFAFIVVLVLATRYLLKLIGLFFDGVGEGRITIEGFDSDWAAPTFKLVRLVVVAFAAVAAYPYIPGSDSEAFKGVSVFIGVVLSFGSSSIIGNTLAGYTLAYRRTFRVGDWVKVGEHIGEVKRIRLLATYLRTFRNEELVVPSSMILSSEVLNYSTRAGTDGLLLHTTVGIGYETPWRQVEAMLLEAAGRVPGLLRSPAPFVLQTGLADFCVNYDLHVYCDDPYEMLPLYTALHRQILDVFNEYGVQIMTPAYMGDPQQPKVVPRSEWYAAPAKAPQVEGRDR